MNVGCSNVEQPKCTNLSRKFDSLATKQIRPSSLETMVTTKDSAVLLAWIKGDSNAIGTQESQALTVIGNYYVKTYILERTGLRFSLIKDRHDSVHLIAHTQLRDWTHNLEGMYDEAKINHRAFVHPINGLRLRDSIRVVRLNTNSLRFLINDIDELSNKEPTSSISEVVETIRTCYKPFMNQLVGFVDLDTYLSTNKKFLAGNTVNFVEQLKDSKSYRYLEVFRGEDIGFFLIYINESYNIEIYFIPMIEVPKTF